MPDIGPYDAHTAWRERQLMLNRIAGLEIEVGRLREERDERCARCGRDLDPGLGVRAVRRARLTAVLGSKTGPDPAQ